MATTKGVVAHCPHYATTNTALPQLYSGTRGTMEAIHYSRSRFATRLYGDRLYTSGHYWLRKHEDDLWRVGLTKFATRMLGDVVEFELEAKPGSPVTTGQTIGWLEAFKAVTDLYAVMPGTFEGPNAELEAEVALLQKDPYERGWIYAVRGTPGEQCVDLPGYTAVLDATIDTMMGKRHE